MVFREATLVFLHAHAQMAGLGGIEGGWVGGGGDKSQAHLVVSDSFFSFFSYLHHPAQLSLMQLMSQQREASGGEKMRADGTGGPRRVGVGGGLEEEGAGRGWVWR